VPSTGAGISSRLSSRGLLLPAGHAVLTLEEHPGLEPAVEHFGSSVWPEFMLHDPVGDRLWPRMAHDFPAYQLALLDDRAAVVAVGRSVPLAWDGTIDDLPRGWDQQFERSVEGFDRGVPPDTLGAIMIVTDPGRRGDGLGGLMLEAMLESARLGGLKALVACVRPTLLERYPLTPIDEYARWTRGDGLPFDPWIRIHVRAGGQLSRPEPSSMRISGSVADWEEWTGMAFPATGEYVVPGACAPVRIDREADSGTYLDPNVWIVHDLA
jgi:GNAT superfamily N-acetyltransferase